MDDRFRVEVIAQTPNPQQIAYAAMHQDYAEEFVWEGRDRFPSETEAGELVVKYLLKGNRGHYGPLEHPQIIFNFGFFPHSTMQQVRTHRNVSFDVQCLAGDTEITFVNIQGHTNRILKKTIGELYDTWTNGEAAVRQRCIRGRNGESPGIYRRDCKNRLKKMRLRVLNEHTGRFEISHIKDIICSGLQPVYRMTLADGKTLDCTTQHRLYTSKGWKTMADAVGLVTTHTGDVEKLTQQAFIMCNGVAAAGSGLYRDRHWLQRNIAQQKSASELATECDCSVTTIRDWTKRYGLSLQPIDTKFKKGQAPWNDRPQALYRDRDWLIAQLEEGLHANQKALVAHPVEVINVEYLGIQMTYDLEVEEPWHNFVANGMVVHNSFRYTGKRILDVVAGTQDIEDVFYLRPVGDYSDREGKKYHYSQDQREQDLAWCMQGCDRYAQRIHEGLSEEHARGLIPFDVRQHWVMSGNARAIMHLLDIRGKFDVQMETRVMTEMMLTHFQAWMPEISEWYEKNRWRKGTLAP